MGFSLPRGAVPPSPTNGSNAKSRTPESWYLSDFMLCGGSHIIFSEERELPHRGSDGGNKLSGFPFRSVTNGMFYQSKPAGKDFVFFCCSLILPSAELRYLFKCKAEFTFI